ncbi:DUF1800 domain-containing protein [Vibrio sp. WXL103]|uniref:DUF1800 domain-containing protein n=1 Tax=Vibrio sp. WXL103 TaxID=3450710 RepID=UPI003EC4C3E3
MENLTYRQASRFLDMATMGIKDGEIESLLNIDDRTAWIDDQISQAYTSHENQTLYQMQQRGESQPSQEMRVCAWFDIALSSPAQLRQRVAFALSQIVVVNDRDSQLSPYPVELAHYYDLLAEHAFGNYRTLLYHVTRSPIMGHFLTMAGNLPRSITGVDPDQNYAREIMQLFSIGLEVLNIDGSPQLDENGQAIATYDDDTIRNVARIFTGWFLDNNGANGVMYDAMVADDEYHDLDEKVVFDEVFPAGIGAEDELNHFLDLLMAHPSTAPNISQLLIKRLVTSNPSSAYIARVASVFSQTNGDLAAVIKAILTDSEVLKENSNQVAKVREPILAMTYVYRALNAYPGQSSDIVYNSMQYQSTFNQYPLGAPSVFNFFSPTHSPEGPLQEAGLTAPELELIDWNQSIKFADIAYKLVWTNGQHRNKSNTKLEMYVNTSDLETLANNDDFAGIVNLLQNRFLHGQMSEQLTAHLQKIYDVHATPVYSIPKLLFFVIISPDFMIQESVS